MTRVRRGRHAPVRSWRPPVITGIREGSPCRGVVRAGDVLLEIDGRRPLDILDYLQASERDRVKLRLGRGGKEISRRLSKEYNTPLGLVFDEVVFDGVRTCGNNCIFCFVDQLPPGLRPSLYVKDDDYRLSFYQGNFITLNNLGGNDLRRILELRLSPLYVSLHSTDPELRAYLMGGGAVGGLEALGLLLEEGLEIHLQVVVCPGINDGGNLARTLEDVLVSYQPASLGLVPVGLTSSRAGRSGGLVPHDRGSSSKVLDMVEEYQAEALRVLGRRLFYAADEFYLMAGRPFPSEEEYDGYPQLDNGVGMSRKLMEEVAGAARGREDLEASRGVLTGEAGEAVIRQATEGVFRGGELEIVTVRNGILGDKITVAGLLGGGDIMRELMQRPPRNRELLIPGSMLRDGRFIDDLGPEEVGGETGFDLLPVEVDGFSLMRGLCAEGCI